MNDDAKPLKSGLSAAEEPSKATHTHADRLTEAASDKQSELPPIDLKNSADPPDPAKDKSMWKILLQLRPFLPYLARLVPVLDVVAGPLQNVSLSHEVRESVAQSAAKIQSIQRDLSTAVTSAIEDQALQLKRLEEEITRLRDGAERQSHAQTQLAKDLDAIGMLLRISAVGLGTLLIALIVMVGILLGHLPH